MDMATIGGIIIGGFVVFMAIISGGNASGFVDVPALLIVMGGGLAAVLIRFPLRGVWAAFKIGARAAVRHKNIDPRDIINEISSISEIARRDGPLALEDIEVNHKFLATGVRYIADGYDSDFIRETMERDRDQYIQRLSEGQRVFTAIGDSLPAFGMIGTLVGLVQMLGAMDDPSQIGPAMAVAILTTLYAAVVANLIAIPIAEKLEAKGHLERVNQSLIIDGILQIREAKSSLLIKEMLLAYLPEKQRLELEAAA